MARSLLNKLKIKESRRVKIRAAKIKMIEVVCFLAGKTEKRFGPGLGLTRPIFIIGTGRCGTSLLAEILRSHREIVRFPGEANGLWHPKLYPFEKAQIDIPPIEVNPQNFTEVSIDSWSPNQAKRIRQTFNGFYLFVGRQKTFFVKSAMISFMMPKIVEIFPDARFIHIYRIGPSVVKSYVKRNLNKYFRYVFTEEEYFLYCAKYWNSCLLEIERAKNSLSLSERDAFFELSYEALCDNPKGMLKSLAAYIGVEESAFTFDISNVKSMNYKAGDYAKDEKWRKLLEVMFPAMKLKGYL